MAAADNIKVKIEVNASDLVEACIKALVEDGTLVEVVRCKDCKYYEAWRENDGCYCQRFSADPYEYLPMQDDDFCSQGERSEDETD